MTNKIPWNPKITIIVGLIKTLYDICFTGGCCHIVTDDDNIEDEHLQYVINYCKRPENADRVDKELSTLICELLLQLSYEQRCFLFYLYRCDHIYDTACFTESDWYKYMDMLGMTAENVVEKWEGLFVGC